MQAQSKMGNLRVGLKSLAVAVLLAASGGQVMAGDVIATGNGGSIVEYARAVAHVRSDKVPVRFSGVCASACTLYLSVPTQQTCIRPGTTFVFHQAWGSNRSFNRWGTEHLMNSYPRWVRSWIEQNGGLSSRNLRMSYTYAAQFIPACAART